MQFNFFEDWRERRLKDCRQFTEEELRILSKAMICLMDSTNEALRKTYDEESIAALKKSMQKYQEINLKICNLNND